MGIKRPGEGGPLIPPVAPVEKVHKDPQRIPEEPETGEKRESSEPLTVKDFPVGSQAPRLRDEFTGLTGRVISHSKLAEPAVTYSKSGEPGDSYTRVVLTIEVQGTADETAEYADKYLLVTPQGEVVGSRARSEFDAKPETE